MSDVLPYFDSWEELRRYVIEKTFQGDKHGHPPRALAYAFSDPMPAVGMFASLGALKQVAIASENRQFAEGVQAGISRVIDEYCAPPHPPGPWPWPPSVIAFELATMANALRESRLRTGILEVASQLFQKNLERVRYPWQIRFSRQTFRPFSIKQRE
jgi:hypothetical protein